MVALVLASGTVPLRGEAVIPIAAQLLVLIGLLAAEVLAGWAATELVATGRLLPVPR